MKKLTQTNLISGGNPAAAVAAAATVITGTAAVIQSFETFSKAGENLGEKIYNKLNPDDGLGKMVYTKEDFKHPNWYMPASQHPNNMSANNFHNSFGGF